MSSYSTWPEFDEEQIRAVQDVLCSGRVNYWTGETGRALEAEFADFSHTEHALAVANGTVALELALHALGIQAGDEVVVPSRTFIATASAVVARGATPVVADVDANSQNITSATIEPCITRRTKAIIVVHLAGRPCEMDDILALAEDRGLYVIEDCAQAHGARYKGRPVGSMSDVGAFSFCQDKIMTTGGEGGMLVTGCREVWRRAWSYRDHGKNYDQVHQPAQSPGFRWLHDSFGSNFRMTEMQAAIGRIQLQRLIGWVQRRQRNAAALQACCERLPALVLPEVPSHIEHSYYRFYVFVRRENLRDGWSRDRIMAALRAEGIPCNSGSCGEIYLEKAFQRFSPMARLPGARQLAETSLAFLVDPTVTVANLQRACWALEQVMRAASEPHIWAQAAA